jgi:hypothetical protein
MWLPPTQAGGQVLGSTFIDGDHMVLADPTRRQLHLLYQNSQVNEQLCLIFPNIYALTYTSGAFPKLN